MVDTNQDLANKLRNTGSLVFMITCLPLAVVGLVHELSVEETSPLPIRLMIMASWILVGTIATIAFFQGLDRKKVDRARLASMASFCLIGTFTAITATILAFLPDASPANSSWPWILGVLAGLGAATIPCPPMTLLLLVVPGILIWTCGGLWGTNTTGAGSPFSDRLADCGLAISLAILPAAAIASCRHWILGFRKERDSLQDRISAFGGELDRARQVHDSMFPEPLDGDVQLEYTYNPLLGIGGDFLHVYKHPRTGDVTATILDVSGHGLAAALTVNRLFGELERICAENPDSVSPDLLMRGLNRYVHLVMADHSLYATSASIQISPDNRKLRWAVAGHPPPMLRRRNGEVIDLECTTVLLGALPSELFNPEQQETPIAVGDVVVAYTDGTFESRNPQGEFFGIDRLRETMKFDTPPREWSRFLVTAVEQFRGKEVDTLVEDDILVFSASLGSRRRVIKINPQSGSQQRWLQAIEPAEEEAPSQVEGRSPQQ